MICLLVILLICDRAIRAIVSDCERLESLTFQAVIMLYFLFYLVFSLFSKSERFGEESKYYYKRYIYTRKGSFQK